VTLTLIISHLVVLALGGYLYRSYAAKAVAEAQEAKAWAESELEDFKAAAAKDVAALRAKLPGALR
jgi:hypothetical protein